MKMYRWSSNRFRDYTQGHITVMARDVGEARRLARDEYEREWGKQQYEDFMDDLKEEPTEETVLFDYGSS